MIDENQWKWRVKVLNENEIFSVTKLKRKLDLSDI